MKVVVIADMHGNLPDLPPCDLLIISGDLTGGNWTGVPDGTDEKWHDWLFGSFAGWLNQQQYDMAVAVGGNHDTCLLRWPELPPGITYLCDSGCEYQGVKIWGAPWVMKFDCLAFNLSPVELAAKWALVPDGTDILVCHGPPFTLGDRVGRANVGDTNLRRRIEELKPRVVTCGHIHEARGVYRLGDTTVINAAIQPITFDYGDARA